MIIFKPFLQIIINHYNEVEKSLIDPLDFQFSHQGIYPVLGYRNILNISLTKQRKKLNQKKVELLRFFDILRC